MVDINRMTPEVLRAYQALCSFCSWVLLDGGKEEGCASLARERNILLEQPFTDIALQDARDLYNFLEKIENQEVWESVVNEIRRDHTYLFLMSGQSLTSPYESVYRTDDATMFGPTTLEVRARYRAYDLAFEKQETEPDDHIGLELYFLAFLLDKAATLLDERGDIAFEDRVLHEELHPAPQMTPEGVFDTFNTDNQEDFARVINEIKTFLSEHLLVFAPFYCTLMQQRAHSLYYRHLAAIVGATIESLAILFDARPAETLDTQRFSIKS